ncbi:MAG TPA: ATP-grasp domain-containing protein [Planctomycetota bacterium]|nr:ATP-grasp domain-containing protein [Planctomycetota bacterium]
MRAMITYARGWNALSATRSLGRRGIEVVTGDENDFAPASLSRYSIAHFKYPNPDREPEAFLDALEAAIRKYRPDVLIPIHKELYLIALHRSRFEPLVKVALPTFRQIEAVHDKGTLARICRERRDLPTPETLVPESREEFERAARGFAYPAFVKVRRSAAAVGVRKVRDSGEALAAFDAFVADLGLGEGSWPLLQEAVGGDDYCATFLFDHGELRATMTYHNLRSFPARSGTGVLRETVAAPQIERIGADFLASLGWHGVAEIDFRWDGKEGEPVLIEVNPRFWGGLPQAVEAGWDYPYLLFRLALEGRVDPVEPQGSSVRTQTPVVGLLATLHEIVHDEARGEEVSYALRKFRGGYVKGNRRRALARLAGSLKAAIDLPGRFRRAGKLLSDHRNAVSDVFRWSDPAPILGFLYPVSVFLRHGSVSTELLVSEGRAAVKAS